MKYEITCRDGETFLLDPIQTEVNFVSGLNADGLVVVIDRNDIADAIQIYPDGTREPCELRHF